MTARTFRITQDRALELATRDSPITDSAHRWIEAGERDVEALRPMLEDLGAHPLAISACLDSVPASLVSVYGSSILLALPTLPRWDAEARAYLWVLCLPGVLITMREGSVSAVEEMTVQYSEGMRLQAPTTSGIVYKVVDRVIDQGLAMTLQTRDAVDRIEAMLEEGKNDDEVAGESVALKRRLTRLEGILEDQLYCLTSLQAIDSPAFSAVDLQDFFRDAFLHLEHSSRVVGRQLSHLTALQQQYQLRLQDRANSRLRLLTIMSTLFLPLTLIAGIYGMNFERIPELSVDNGYFFVLAAMVVIAAGMLLQFYRRGWFE